MITSPIGPFGNTLIQRAGTSSSDKATETFNSSPPTERKNGCGKWRDSVVTAAAESIGARRSIASPIVTKEGLVESVRDLIESARGRVRMERRRIEAAAAGVASRRIMQRDRVANVLTAPTEKFSCDASRSARRNSQNVHRDGG